ncbi:hypothetical protein B0H15DRAFT_951825 [Mycena belliarum]|uniref:Uncharacterized protein n=1 Tax=Mycena belliarum TaxID=1033014 RepID=A0AAD6U481_9AGAR|nr:hypothetical protein B0H15DRAFT_951825 [Mycena belliae]
MYLRTANTMWEPGPTARPHRPTSFSHHRAAHAESPATPRVGTRARLPAATTSPPPPPLVPRDFTTTSRPGHAFTPPGPRLATPPPANSASPPRAASSALRSKPQSRPRRAPSPAARAYPRTEHDSAVPHSLKSHWRAKDGPARNRRPGRKSRGRSVRAVCPSASHRQYAGSSLAPFETGPRASLTTTYATRHYTTHAPPPASTLTSLRAPHPRPVHPRIPALSVARTSPRLQGFPRARADPTVFASTAVRAKSGRSSLPPRRPRRRARSVAREFAARRASAARTADRGIADATSPPPLSAERPPRVRRPPPAAEPCVTTRRPRPKTCAAVKAKFARGAATPSPRRSSLGARQAACCRASPAAHLPPSTSALAAQLSSPPARRLCSDAPHPAPPRANRSSPNAGLDAGVGVSGRPASPTINEREVRSLRSPRDAAAGVSKSQRAGAVLVLAHGGVERAVLAERVPRTPQTRMDVEPWICERHPRSRHPSPSDSGPDLRAASRLATSPETPRPPRFPRARADPLRLASARRSFRRLGRHSRAAHPCAANRVVLLRARASPLGRGSRVFPTRRAESARAVVLQREVSACNERTRFGALAALCSARDSRRIAARGGARTRTGRFGSSSAAQVLRRGAGERAALPEHADSSGTSDQGSFDLMRARRATDVPEPARRVEWGALRVGCAHGSQVKSDRARCPQSSRYKDAIRDGTRAKRGSGHGIPVRDLPRCTLAIPADAAQPRSPEAARMRSLARSLGPLAGISSRTRSRGTHTRSQGPQGRLLRQRESDRMSADSRGGTEPAHAADCEARPPRTRRLGVERCELRAASCGVSGRSQGCDTHSQVESGVLGTLHGARGELR